MRAKCAFCKQAFAKCKKGSNVFGLNFLAFGEGSFAKGMFDFNVKDRTN